MSLKISNWNPTSSYKASDKVVFYDKIYVALRDNKEVLPIPVVGDGFTSNYDSVSKIALNYYNEVEGHLNTQKVRAWILL